MHSKVYKCCVVPRCTNTSIKTPKKLFIYVPNNKTMRYKWLTLARRDPTGLSLNTSIYFCEDHFDLPHDMDNYMEYHVMGSVSQVRMKPGCIPTKFECQIVKRKRTPNTKERPYNVKKLRRALIKEFEIKLEKKSITKKHLELGEPSSSGSVLRDYIEEDLPENIASRTTDRLEKQILEIELTYQEQRTRLVAEIRAENERIAAELAEKEKTQRDEIEKWRQAEERTLKEKRSQLEHEIAQEKAKLEEQLKQKQEDLEKRFEEHKKEFEAEQQVMLKKKVTEIAAQHKQERDREIEKAIESMEAEAQMGRKELQEALRRNKEQFELELKELAETEQATLRRYQDAQARVRQTEDRCAELEVSVSQLETRNRILTEKNSQLEARAEEAREKCEKEWQAKVDALNKNLEDMKRIHEEQMQQLYAKVKVAVARKDSAIQALNRENGKYQEKITILEQKLQQQRKDFLKQK